MNISFGQLIIFVIILILLFGNLPKLLKEITETLKVLAQSLFHERK